MADDPLLIGTGNKIPTPPPAPEVFVGPKTPPPPPTPPEGLPRIRTYAADLSEEIRERGTTLSSIVTAEQARKPKAEGPLLRSEPRTLMIAALAFFLIVLGVASVSAAVFFRKKSEPVVITTSVIFPNRTVTIDTAKGPLGTQLVALRENENPSLGEIERILVLSDGVPIVPQDLATALGVPTALVREVTDTMIGIHAFDGNQPFIIFRIAAYDRAFATTLQGESNMARSLGTFFAPSGQPPPAGPPTLVFRDAIIENLDVRRSQDAWPIVYTFPSQYLLIVTTNEYTVREVLARLGISR